MLDELADDQEVDLYPATKKDHTQMVAKCTRLFTQSEAWRRSFLDRWEVWYKLSQSHSERAQGDWGSIVFVPKIYTILDTIKSRIIAQLPEPIVNPVEASDVEAARDMETMLKWSAEQSDLYLELVKAYDSALRYGTGILKITPMKRSVIRRKRQPVMEPMMAQMPLMDPETGQPMTGPDGSPVMQTQQQGEQPSGRTEVVEQEVITYIGPKAEAIDISLVYVDPMCDDFDNAEYVIHQAFKSKTWCEQKFASGFFHRPPYFSDGEYKTAMDDPAQHRLSLVKLGGGVTEPDRIEVWEAWYRDGTVITILNRTMVVRVVANPYDHGEYPFVRIVDGLTPHEFYGTGEVQHLEGVQDLINTMVNQRVDNVRLAMEKVFIGDRRAIRDRADLRIYPGAFIPVENPDSQPLSQVITTLEMGDVTNSSYNEVAYWEQQLDRTSGVTGYQTGADTPGMNQTATGIALITENGNSRFSLKMKMAELTGLRDLYRQYGALLQQFVPEDFIMRIMGPDGNPTFKQVEPGALYGAFDFDIEAESSAQTETQRRQDAMDNLNTAVAAVKIDPSTGAQSQVFNVEEFGKDYVRSRGKKNVDAYMAVPPPPQAPPPGLPPQMQQGGPMAQPNGQPVPNGQPQPQGMPA